MHKDILKRVLIIALLLTLLTQTTVLAAEPEYSYSQKVYVHDLANLLTNEEEQELEELAAYYCTDFDLNVLFLTMDDADGKSTMQYSDDYMDNVFPIGVENNIAFVIDMDNREYYINTMGVAITKLSDDEIDIALDEAYPEMSSGNYYGAFKDMATYCLSEITGKSSLMMNGLFAGLLTAMIACAIIAAIPTAIIVIWLILAHNSANKTQSATKYLSNENYAVINKDEVLIRSYETVQIGYYRPKSSSSGGSRSGSSHRSSSGRSHGGGGRRF